MIIRSVNIFYGKLQFRLQGTQKKNYASVDYNLFTQSSKTRKNEQAFITFKCWLRLLLKLDS